MYYLLKLSCFLLPDLGLPAAEGLGVEKRFRMQTGTYDVF